MDNFSVRHGFKERSSLQLDGISSDLRNQLWNIIDNYFRSKIEHPVAGYDDSRFMSKTNELVVEEILCKHFKMRKSKIPNDANEVMKLMEKRYNEIEWYEVLDLFEFFIKGLGSFDSRNLTEKINDALKRESSGYSMSEKIFVSIIDEAELNEVNKASEVGFEEVEKHLKKAKTLMSPSNKEPDYQNSIKESISALEAYFRLIENNEMILSINIKKGEKAKEILHQCLIDALRKLYGYASDASGVRHAIKSGVKEDYHFEAPFMLVVCSAYINLIKNKLESKQE